MTAENEPMCDDKVYAAYLLACECFGDIELAMQREKAMRHRFRQWKINRIACGNPHSHDRYSNFFEA
jgi:predicted GIY-YIG superfamily endonuclease